MAEATRTMVLGGTEVLVRAGLRATPPRLAIWQTLCAADDGPDAVELLRRAATIEPRTSLGTVYRFLRELEQRGLAFSRPIAHQRARWHAGTADDTTATPRDPEAVAAVARLAAAFGYRLVPMPNMASTD
jgi:Ferric uptake regulator family